MVNFRRASHESPLWTEPCSREVQTGDTNFEKNKREVEEWIDAKAKKSAKNGVPVKEVSCSVIQTVGDPTLTKVPYGNLKHARTPQRNVIHQSTQTRRPSGFRKRGP